MENTLEILLEILPLLIPLILIDLGIRVYAIIDIVNPERLVTLNNNKVIWIIIIALVNFGGIIYLLVGKKQ
jgi:hypothetical protein